MSYQNLVDEHMRICILKSLKSQSDYSLNESLLCDLLGPFGFSVSRQKIKTELAWLEELGLVKITEVMGLMVAVITERGVDVAEGKSIVPGIKRPGPNS